MENIRIKIATPISSLFWNNNDARQLIALSDCLECRNLNFTKNIKIQQIFHFEQQIIHPLKDGDFLYFQHCFKKRSNLKLVSFHVASCYIHPVVLDDKFYPFGKKISIDKMLKTSRINIERIRKLFGRNVDIAIENNNYYPTGAYDDITDGDFISSLVKSNNLFFLLDVSHAAITSFFRKKTINEYIDSLPMSRLIQIHLSRKGIDKNGLPYDAHNNITAKVCEDCVKIIHKYKSVKYISIEYYKEPAKLSNSLRIIRKIINNEK